MYPADTFIIFLYTIKITIIYGRLGLRRIVILPSATREQAQNNGRGPCQKTFGRSWFRMHWIKMERSNLIVILQNYVR